MVTLIYPRDTQVLGTALRSSAASARCTRSKFGPSALSAGPGRGRGRHPRARVFGCFPAFSRLHSRVPETQSGVFPERCEIYRSSCRSSCDLRAPSCVQSVTVRSSPIGIIGDCENYRKTARPVGAKCNSKLAHIRDRRPAPATLT